MSQKTNRLIDQSSPYLLQHAHNPVDWYPWGEEALQKAKDEKKMMIVSIGYAACHWCHVMEKESFEDSSVARIMNEHFVSIKVDREERPDIDQIYMDAAMLISGRGGWPLNVITMPDGRPVYAGTYFPQESWIKLLNHFIELYRDDPDKMILQADQLTRGIASIDNQSLNFEEKKFATADLDKIFQKMYTNLDTNKGGSMGAPKFPLPNKYRFLLEYYYHTENKKALNAVINTLDKMAMGGIYDHVGGGFARYSTDDIWLVPHFEKMLYDNAQLISLYSQAYQLTKDPVYKEVVYQTLEFIARELTSPEGGFYSSLDADSEGEEGKFYVWDLSEVEQILGNDHKIFTDFYDVSPQGNWEGKNILRRKRTLEEFAKKNQLSIKDVQRIIGSGKEKLLKQRATRVRPGLDDKILTSWNALMIKGYIDAYRTFDEPDFLKAAIKNGEFLWKNALQDGNKLNRNFKDGKSSIHGFLDDYSFTIEAFIRLYEATFEEKWLYKAKDLADFVLDHFDDQESGLFYYTSSLDNPLIVRKKELSDNVIPASNSSMAKGLTQLGNYFYQEKYLDKAKLQVNNLKRAILENPGFYSNWALVIIDLTYPLYEVAIVGPQHKSLREALDDNFLPNIILMGGEKEGTLELLKNKLVKDQTFIYVCRDKACKLPTKEVKTALTLIE